MHHKRRRRRRGGIKGHCSMCGDRGRRYGLRHLRRLTKQEQHSLLTLREEIRESGC